MNQHVEQLQRQQDSVPEHMRQLRLMYCGTLSEQRYAERYTRKDGAGATGPYFLWQGTRQGKRFGRRVNAQQAQRIREGLETRHRFEALCAQFVALGEALAECAAKALEDCWKMRHGVGYRQASPETGFDMPGPWGYHGAFVELFCPAGHNMRAGRKRGPAA